MPKSLARMTTRSVVLSVLLATHPACASTGELLRLIEDFDIKDATLRVALTRMVSAGDLIRSADGYRLSERLLARQRRQDEAIHPRVRPWNGDWATVVVTSVGNDARTRATLRAKLSGWRFAELREGVWMRPDNLDGAALDADVRFRSRVITVRDADPAGLARQLWDLPGWAKTGEDLLEVMTRVTDMRTRFTAAAALVRHLFTDPVLPEELLPPDWPGERLRTEYAAFVDELTRRRDVNRVVGVL